MKPVIALVGRPNVGKSTLFNRLTRSRDAIVHDLPGVTRDRHYGEGLVDGRSCIVIDTGGLEPDTPKDIYADMARFNVLPPDVPVVPPLPAALAFVPPAPLSEPPAPAPAAGAASFSQERASAATKAPAVSHRSLSNIVGREHSSRSSCQRPRGFSAENGPCYPSSQL